MNDGANLDDDVVLAFGEPKQASDEPIEYSDEDSAKIEIEPKTFAIGQGGVFEEADDLQSVDISNQVFPSERVDPGEGSSRGDLVEPDTSEPKQAEEDEKTSAVRLDVV
ncbi:hypothetical protein THAOC_24837 [Thalassiosira oceanica]|uniref:Uncharacterized protein n=1 Tax=Thalassiosira oceanica TaxID=159749 RepID=K0S337_THAOC|nr:hypothetical protein THAOC_24837 [Thalassiosira oceanica]|eukprot:EJK55431.1 hypothetical protein THAOC_24837 [Thalassiosira oceanica]